MPAIPLAGELGYLDGMRWTHEVGLFTVVSILSMALSAVEADTAIGGAQKTSAFCAAGECPSRLLVCGDGLPDPGEECDDGNQISGDGCSALCQLEIPIECGPQIPWPSQQNILEDGSFEDDNILGTWTTIEHSLFGPDLICDDQTCFAWPFAAGPDGSLVSGRYVLIAGGSFSDASTGLVVHAPVAIPSNATTLEFQWATIASGPAGNPCAGATDGLTLFIGGTEVWSSLDAGPCTNVNPYERVVIDLTTASGGPYQGATVGFEFQASASGVPPNIDLTNIMLDDVSINIPPDTDPPGHDCELDGVPDNLDNCIIIANADQRDSDGDFYGNRCDADLNNDCIVNAIDLGMLKTVFFGNDPDADFNGDGFVNAIDLGILKNLFFHRPGPSGVGGNCP